MSNGRPVLLHSMATPETDAVGCLDAAATLGLDGIELIVDDEYSSAIRLRAGQDSRLQLRHEALARNLRILALSSYERDLDHPDDATRDVAISSLRRTVDLASALGAEHVRVLAGSTLGARNFPSVASRFGDAAHAVGDYAASAGISLNVEIHMDTLATSAQRTAELVDAADSAGVGVLYDQANLAIMGAERPAEALQALGGRVRHMHVKNFVPSGSDRTPVGLADGVVDWRDAFAQLDHYIGAITLEYERRWYELPPATIGLPGDLNFLRSLDDASPSSRSTSTRVR